MWCLTDLMCHNGKTHIVPLDNSCRTHQSSVMRFSKGRSNDREENWALSTDPTWKTSKKWILPDTRRRGA
jgi:hypothetical protein